MIRYCVTMFLGLGVCSLTATEPVVVYEGTDVRAPKQPQAFMDSEDNVHVAFGSDGRIFYASLRVGKNADINLGEPREVALVPNMSLGMRRGPRIAASAREIVVTAIGGAQGKGIDGDVLAYRSVDGGKSWNGPVTVNDVPASAREGLHAMTVTSDGIYWCAWLDLRVKKTELYAAKSTDGGRTWQQNVLVYRSPGGSICECCHPSLVADGDDLHVLFRNALDGNRDMYIVSSNDAGKTWSDARRLGKDHWQLNACPMDGGMIATHQGKLSAVWRRGGSIYLTSDQSPLESPIGRGEQPWISVTDDGPLVVWTSAREGDLLLSRGQANPEVLIRNARDAVIVSGHGQVSRSLVLCEQRQEATTKILAIPLSAK